LSLKLFNDLQQITISMHQQYSVYTELRAALMMPKEAALVAKSSQELAELCGTSVESATYRIKTLVKLNLLPANHSLWEYLPEQ
jgi:hypothetical protein